MTEVAERSAPSTQDEGTDRADGSVPSPAPRLGLAVGAMFLVALPLVADPSGWFVYLPLRWLAILTAIGVMGAAVWRSGAGFRAPAGRRWWLALVLVACTSALLSSAPRVSFVGSGDRLFGASTWLLHGALVALGATVVRRRTDLLVLARAMSVGLLGVAVVTLAQRGGWDVPAGTSSYSRPGGPFGNANFLGAYCVLAVLVSAGVALDRDESPRWRAVAAGAVTAGLGVAVLTGSRSSWLAILVGGGWLAGMHLRRDPSPRVALRTAGVVAAVTGFCLLIGVLAGAGDRLEDLTDGTARGRVDTWAVAVDVVARRPVLGWGPEGVAEGMTGSIDDGWEQDYGRRLTPDRAHNGLLDIGASLGVVGLVVYAGAVASTARRTHRTITADRTDPGARHTSVVLGLAGGLGAYLLHQQLLFPLFDVDALAWFLAGAVGALVATPVRPGAGLGPGLKTALKTMLGTVLGAVLGAALLVAGASAFVADRHARDAADALAQRRPLLALELARASLERSPAQTLPALVAADAGERVGTDEAVQDALQLVRTARADGFDDGRLTLAEARLLLRRADPTDLDRARLLLETQLLHDRARSEAWLLLGDVHDAAGDRASATHAWREAARLAPRRSAPLTRLATAYAAANRPRQARELIARIEALRGDDAGPLPADLALLRARLQVPEGDG